MHITLESFGDVQVSRRLLRFGLQAENMKPLFEQLANDFNEIERRQFDSEGAFASGGWAPLDDDYARRKAEMFGDKPLMQATGALFKSLTEPDAPGSIRTITDDTMELGTDVRSPGGFPYAAAHQNPKKGQTRRRVIELRDEDRVRWTKATQRWMRAGELGTEASGLAGALSGL